MSKKAIENLTVPKVPNNDIDMKEYLELYPKDFARLDFPCDKPTNSNTDPITLTENTPFVADYSELTRKLVKKE